MKRLLRRMMLVPAGLCISLIALSSCEEDTEIFDRVDIEMEKQTDDGTSNKSKPGGN